MMSQTLHIIIDVQRPFSRAGAQYAVESLWALSSGDGASDPGGPSTGCRPDSRRERAIFVIKFISTYL